MWDEQERKGIRDARRRELTRIKKAERGHEEVPSTAWNCIEEMVKRHQELYPLTAMTWLKKKGYWGKEE